MRFRSGVAWSLGVLCCGVASGKDKKKVLLPADVLAARSVVVLIDPDAGVAVDAPHANQQVRDAVEKALMQWGRFELATDVSTADLVITVRKGNGRIVQPTIGGLPQNDRPVILEPTDSGGRVGGSHGGPPISGDPGTRPAAIPGPQLEAGPAEDEFVVYRGSRENPLDAPAVWRYSGKNALRAPAVPAVDAFRKLVIESEQQLAGHP